MHIFAGKVVLIYFVGGYTFSEVAAFRHLQTILGNQFIIAGTSSISGKSVMDVIQWNEKNWVKQERKVNASTHE